MSRSSVARSSFVRPDVSSPNERRRPRRHPHRWVMAAIRGDSSEAWPRRQLRSGHAPDRWKLVRRRKRWRTVSPLRGFGLKPLQAAASRSLCSRRSDCLRSDHARPRPPHQFRGSSTDDERAAAFAHVLTDDDAAGGFEALEAAIIVGEDVGALPPRPSPSEHRLALVRALTGSS